MICRPPINPERPTLEIRDISHEVLECVPQAANLERIRMVLRESAWGGLGSDLEKKSKKRKRGDVRKWTKAQLESVVQASEGELERGLRERNVVEIDGMPPFYSWTDNRSNAITTRQEIGASPQPHFDPSHDTLEHHEGHYNFISGTNDRWSSGT
jgi:hypothetical protein